MYFEQEPGIFVNPIALLSCVPCVSCELMFCCPLLFSTFLYLKFLVVWALVLLADFVLEFRFEYLWPFWLFIRSVYDSFRYQGLVRITDIFFDYDSWRSDVSCATLHIVTGSFDSIKFLEQPLSQKIS